MADIKTRDAVKGTIKTIDKAAVASERMKSAYAKTKDKGGSRAIIQRKTLRFRICRRQGIPYCRACDCGRRLSV